MKLSEVFFNVNDERNTGVCSKAGTACFAPIRYLWSGKTITLGFGNYYMHNTDSPSFTEMARAPWKAVASCICLIPGVILGTIFKAIDCCFESSRKRYKIIQTHFTPVDRTIGSPDKPLDNKGISEEMAHIVHEVGITGLIIKNLIVHAKPKTELKEDWLANLVQEKLIVVGEEIAVHKDLSMQMVTKGFQFSVASLSVTEVGSVNEAFDYAQPYSNLGKILKLFITVNPKSNTNS